MHFDDSSEHRLLVQHLHRDICMLYHELADYSHIMGDLDYHNLYTLPYWKFIANTGLDWQTDAFIREGSLVMLLAMAWDCIDGSGAYLTAHLSDAKTAVAAFPITDDQTTQLLSVVESALDLAASGQPVTDEPVELRASSGWVHDAYVKEYFIGTAPNFGPSIIEGEGT